MAGDEAKASHALTSAKRFSSVHYKSLETLYFACVNQSHAQICFDSL